MNAEQQRLREREMRRETKSRGGDFAAHRRRVEKARRLDAVGRAA